MFLLYCLQYITRVNCVVFVHNVPVKGSWTSAIWLPDVPLLPLVPSVEIWVSCMKLLSSIILEGGRAWVGRCLKAGTPKVFCPIPSDRALWAPHKGFSHRRAGRRAFKRERFLFECDAKFSHSFFHPPWRKTSSKEKDLEVQIAPHLTRKMSHFSGLLQWGEFFCCFSCGSRKIMASGMLSVCGEVSNRFGQLEHSSFEKVASFYGTWVEIQPTFTLQTFYSKLIEVKL